MKLKYSKNVQYIQNFHFFIFYMNSYSCAFSTVGKVLYDDANPQYVSCNTSSFNTESLL